MSREFDGSDKIVLDEGALDTVLNSAWTIVCLFKATSIPDFMCMLSIEAAGPAQRAGLWLDSSGNMFVALAGFNYEFTGLTVSTSVWYLGVVKKTAGTATPRAGMFNYTTDTWSSWVNSSTGTADNDATTITQVTLGDWPNTNPFVGRIAAAGVFATALSDGNAETLEDSAANWIALTPGGMWRLNQASVATNVTDDTGGGANQTAITGTAVSGDEPDPWSYALSADAGSTASPWRLPTPGLLGPTAEPRPWLGVPSAVPPPQVVSLGQVTETDTAQAITGRKTATAGQATESTLAQAIESAKTATLGLATQTDTAQAITVGRTLAIGQVSDTSAAQVVTWAPKHRLVEPATATDTAHAIDGRKTAAVGQASAADQAQAVTWAPQHRFVGQATETAAAQPISARKADELGQVSQTDTAQPLTRHKAKTIGQATEADQAQSVTPPGELVVEVGQVVETSSAQPITSHKALTLGSVSTTDAALGVAGRKTLLVGTVASTEAAQALSTRKTATVGQAAASDAALGVSPVRSRQVGQATTADQAAALGVALRLGQATETDTAQAMQLPPATSTPARGGTQVRSTTALARTRSTTSEVRVR